MVDLTGELTPIEQVVLAVDTSDLDKAVELASMARSAGALIIKQGLELASAPGSSWEFCSQNAAESNLDWVADAKIHDIPNTTAGIVRNIVRTEHPPLAITIHASSGVDSMKKAQEIAGEAGVVMLGVTELTSKHEEELKEKYDFLFAKLEIDVNVEELEVRNALVHMLARDVAIAGLGGLVGSAFELVDPFGVDPMLKSKLKMIPGTRSKGAATHDQQNVATPYQAIVDGADLLVIGRQVTQSENPAQALDEVVTEIVAGRKVKEEVA